MKKQHNTLRNIFSVVGASLAALSLIVLVSVAAEGQTVHMPSAHEESASVRGIAFPVAELGNCASKNECKNYCNEPANMEACIAFAKDHGLMTEKDAQRAEKFTKHVREGSGPGKCSSPESCEQYCGNISHIEECMAFAEKNGFKDEHYEQGKKIQGFLKNGGVTPGNCQTKQECESYCENFNHTKECFDFAQKAGIMKKGENSSHEPNADQLGKIAELAERGETPGKCDSKDACEKYCRDASHRDECVDFGLKIGFIQPDEAAKIKQMGGKGPGDCNSQESCHAYCNDQSHHEECFKFAEEHGFITKEESAQAKEGWVRARQGFENVPPEVRGCLETTLGANILNEIQSGTLVPGPGIGNQVRGCFEKFGGNAHPQEAFKNIPPEAAACLKEKFGTDFDKIRTGKASTTPEMADSFRTCFQNIRTKEGSPQQETAHSLGREGITTQEEKGRRNPFSKPENEGEMPNNQGMVEHPTSIQEVLRSAPPAVATCLKEKFPEGFPATADAPIAPEMKDKIRECFENFRPEIKPGMTSSGEGGNPPVGQTGVLETETEAPRLNTRGLSNMPPEILACIRGAIGEDTFLKIQTAPPSLELVGVIRTCIEKMSKQGIQEGQFFSPTQPTSIQPVTFLEKFIGAALLPLRWILGK